MFSHLGENLNMFLIKAFFYSYWKLYFITSIMDYWDQSCFFRALTSAGSLCYSCIYLAFLSSIIFLSFLENATENEKITPIVRSLLEEPLPE